jgi:hypothetical protein
MKARLSSLLGVAVITAAMSIAVSTYGVPYSFNIDSSQSTLTLSGAAFGLPVSGQGGNPATLVDHWGGYLNVDLTGGVLTFSPGSIITAALNPTAPFSTFPNPGSGGVDNYGVFGSGLVSGVGLVLQLNGAYRSLVFDITSGTVQDGQAPSGMNLQLTAGHLDWGAIVSPNTPFGGTSSLIGVGGANISASLASWDGTTLVLPVHINTGLYSNRIEDYLGTIVAVIPEPSSVALALVGLGLLAARARARARR